jgi:hypothetical protein
LLQVGARRVIALVQEAFPFDASEQQDIIGQKWRRFGVKPPSSSR